MHCKDFKDQAEEIVLQKSSSSECEENDSKDEKKENKTQKANKKEDIAKEKVQEMKSDQEF